STRKNIQRRYSTDSTNTFDLLHATGRDCVGSLSLVPETEIKDSVALTKLEPLSVDDLRSIITAHKQQNPLGMINKH
ncbi:HipA N-terminal domain-containing protein, partial [Escherichia coli]|nr:HipA N-terminal domain-containing protein [Escherichia coli]